MGDSKTPFPLATFPGLLCFTLDMYLMMLNVEQGSINYHFFILWYNSTWNWTLVCWAMGEHSTRKANEPDIYIIDSVRRELKSASCFYSRAGLKPKILNNWELVAPLLSISCVTIIISCDIWNSE